MPWTEGSGKAAELRKAYADAQARLEGTNIRLSEVKAALQATDPEQRTKLLDTLAMGSERRGTLFAEYDKALKEYAAAQQTNDPVRKVDTQDELNRVEVAIEATNLSARRLENELGLFQDSIEKARRTKKQAVVDEKLAERAAKIEQLKNEADFPARKQVIDAFVRSYDTYAEVRGAVDDAEDLKRLLRGSGVLEFYIAVTDPQIIQSMTQRLRTDGPTPRPGDTARWFEVDRPEEFVGLPYVAEYGDKTWMLLSTLPEHAMVHREGEKPWGLQGARRDFDMQRGRNVVGFTFDTRGGLLFGELTSQNVQRPLAIVLDDKVISAPNINSPITTGSGIIEGSFTDAELDYLIRTMNAGSLPARLADEPISERTIGPSLGADNLRAGFNACIAGIVVVAVFMIGYYYLSGLVAVIAVLMNLVLILGIMAMFNATFTLPGIAALVLTIGMAVDANVLIFERLREEQLRGLSLRMAIRNAYDRAFSAIFDSNVTTVLTSVILYIFGSEEVKGFGLTLAIGITTSMFTSLYVTRTIFAFLTERLEVKKLGSLPLSFPRWDQIMKPGVDWLSKAWIFYAFSTVVIVGGLIAFFAQGRNMYDIEFVSGTSATIELRQPTEIGQVRGLLEKPEHADALRAVQVVSVGTAQTDYEIVTANENTQEVREAIQRAMGDRLNVEVKSEFAGANQPFDVAMGNQVIQVGTEPIVVDGYTAPSSVSFQGDVAILLSGLNPQLTPRQIHDRIERVRLEPGSNLPFREVRVDSPARDENAPTATAVVFFGDPIVDYERDPNTWQEQLARPMWRLVNDAIGSNAPLRRVTSFNPQVAAGAKMDASLALFLSALGITLYVWARFGDLKFGTATVVSLLHDVLITVAVLGLSMYVAETAVGRALLLEPFRINLTMIAAILTVMGYSVNDTIVVFDRIRENRGKFGHLSRQVINDSINQTFSRTLLTGGTTIVTLLVMYITGGAGIHGFTFALLVGILVGTYSSIAIAAPILLLGNKEATSQAPNAQQQQKAPVGQLQRVGQ
jgi:SecD/SecF fusion protein